MAKKAKQEDLPGVTGPGVAPPRISEIDKAADKYVTLRNDRMVESEKEKDAKATLIELMLKHQEELGVDTNGEIIYRFDDEVVIYKPGKPDVKVKTVTEVT